jgi:hypothetical protein
LGETKHLDEALEDVIPIFFEFVNGFFQLFFWGGENAGLAGLAQQLAESGKYIY